MIRVRFWGTRGSIASPGQETQRYGGNTSCLQVVGFEGNEPGASARPGNPHVILDGGTGLSLLQTTLLNGPCSRGQGELHICMSHYHWDHLIGLPSFGPLLTKGNRLYFYGISVQSLQSSIERLFTSVYSPVEGAQNIAAELVYRSVEPAGMDVNGFQMRALENRHPGRALSFRLQYGPHAVVYSTDHEAGDPEIDARLVELARGAQLWVLDAMFTARERPKRVEWGHSSYLEAIQLALEAEVEIAVLFHHEPSRDDDALDRMGFEAAEMAAGTQTQVLVARDGMVVDVGNTR